MKRRKISYHYVCREFFANTDKILLKLSLAYSSPAYNSPTYSSHAHYSPAHLRSE